MSAEDYFPFDFTEDFDSSDPPFAEDSCPSCHEGVLVLRHNKETRQHFLGCSKFPECRYTFSL